MREVERVEWVVRGRVREGKRAKVKGEKGIRAEGSKEGKGVKERG